MTDIFGSLPDTIEDDWIESVEELEERMDEYIHLRDQAQNAFEVRYHETPMTPGSMIEYRRAVR